MIITEQEKNIYIKIRLYVRIIMVVILSALIFTTTLFSKKDYS